MSHSNTSCGDFIRAGISSAAGKSRANKRYMCTAQPGAFIGTEAEEAAQNLDFCGSAALTKPHDRLSVCIYCSVHLGDSSLPLVLISHLNVCSSGEMGINWVAGLGFG